MQTGLQVHLHSMKPAQGVGTSRCCLYAAPSRVAYVLLIKSRWHVFLSSRVCYKAAKDLHLSLETSLKDRESTNMALQQRLQEMETHVDGYSDMQIELHEEKRQALVVLRHVVLHIVGIQVWLMSQSIA